VRAALWRSGRRIVPAKFESLWLIKWTFEMQNPFPKNFLGDLGMTPIVKKIIAAVLLLLIAVVLNPFHSVQSGTRMVITQFGEVVRVAEEGLTFIVPFMQKGEPISIRAESVSIKRATAASSDIQQAYTSITVRYALVPSKVGYIYSNFSKTGDLDQFVSTATTEALKSATAKFTAPQLIGRRDEVNAALTNLLQNKLNVYGAKVVAVDMTDFSFSDSYMKAIDDKTTQEQQALASEASQRKVRSEQEMQVIAAQAQAKAAQAKADGEAYAKLKVAESEAKSLRLLNDAIAQNREVLELKRLEVAMVEAQRWNGARVANQYFGSAPVQVQHLGGK
jgi:prohibitin 2